MLIFPLSDDRVLFVSSELGRINSFGLSILWTNDSSKEIGLSFEEEIDYFWVIPLIFLFSNLAIICYWDLRISSWDALKFSIFWFSSTGSSLFLLSETIIFGGYSIFYCSLTTIFSCFCFYVSWLILYFIKLISQASTAKSYSMLLVSKHNTIRKIITDLRNLKWTPS